MKKLFIDILTFLMACFIIVPIGLLAIALFSLDKLIQIKLYEKHTNRHYE